LGKALMKFYIFELTQPEQQDKMNIIPWSDIMLPVEATMSRQPRD
jgi:hypothetical protein